jgi:two-component system, cell cycle sensor histidine kinase and response regulator CckA
VNVRVVRTFQAGKACVLAEEALLVLAIRHLVANALEAMPEGGDLTIATNCDNAAGLIEISVSDTGVGMSEATLARMFDPFFTTRSGAAGLGLAIVFGMTKSHEGSVEAESRPGHGTTVRLRLPVVEAAVSRGPRQEIEEPKALVIDDDEGVRRVVVRTLERLGFRCDEASNGLDGLARIERDHEVLSLVILDSIMPGLAGEQVFAQTRAIAPKLAVLRISGHLSTGEDTSIPYDEHAGFLAKPFATTDLKRAVEALVLVQSGSSSSAGATGSG